ncbi:MAG: sigma-70 family RNA polymerase sigma factor [Mogibacterium sp.]|nr:sigma-70 family RNA polymerase sigma factor [Mogibacterium sp.]MBQ6500336.1 sigma-70 family RNA polymerase sigma factor [Mogibacterium sp.]
MNEKLINEAIAGSKEAFCSLYGEYKDRLYRYALYRLGDPTEAEDAVSDCVLAAWKSISSLRSEKAFGSWIFRILSNCCASRIKEMIGTRENLERLYDAGTGSISAPPSLSMELAEALAQLGDDDRDIVLLSVIGGLNSTEIASLTDLAPGSVRSKLSRSLAKMREFLS